MSKKIKIRIYPDGRIQAETQGIKGKSCMDYIKTLENILVARAVDSNYTPEYYEDNNVISEQTELQSIEAR